MALATGQMLIIWYSLCHYALDQNRDSDTLYDQTLGDCFALTFVGFEGALVQVFLAHRAASLLGRSRWRFLYWALLLTGILAGLAGSFLYLVASFLSRAGNTLPLFTYATGCWLWGCTLTDLLITATLVVSLRRNITGFSQQTDGVLSMLIRLAIQSAAPTALMSLIGAVLAFSFDDDSIWANTTGAFWQPLAALYGLSLVATLNGRARVREAASVTVRPAGYTTSHGHSGLPHLSELESVAARHPHSGVLSASATAKETLVQVGFPQGGQSAARGSESDSSSKEKEERSSRV